MRRLFLYVFALLVCCSSFAQEKYEIVKYNNQIRIKRMPNGQWEDVRETHVFLRAVDSIKVSPSASVVIQHEERTHPLGEGVWCAKDLFRRNVKESLVDVFYYLSGRSKENISFTIHKGTKDTLSVGFSVNGISYNDKIMVELQQGDSFYFDVVNHEEFPVCAAFYYENSKGESMIISQDNYDVASQQCEIIPAHSIVRYYETLPSSTRVGYAFIKAVIERKPFSPGECYKATHLKANKINQLLTIGVKVKESNE